MKGLQEQVCVIHQCKVLKSKCQSLLQMVVLKKLEWISLLLKEDEGGKKDPY